MIGKTLGHYKILSQLGRGGMGEVYLAEDLFLDRKVALKFLPEAFTSDPERMARFEREAKLLASLNHPNIAAIYGLEQAEGKRFLVLEYVEGETMQARLSKGALPVEDALGVCRQIAEGLEAAHEKGVIHRDLKPANVMITSEEKVKILDFGLAKALADEIQSVDSSQSPTITEAMTQPGVVLGTAAYMSAEQAKGKSVDKRTDIWAFGCILYECLTGKKVFEGETVTETLAAILKGEPDWKALPPTTPPNIRFVLRRCLEKDVGQRFRDASDVRIEIEEARGIGEAKQSVKRSWLAWSVAAVLAIALGLVLWSPWSAVRWSDRPLVRLNVDLGSDVSLDSRYGPAVIISPDGNRIAFVSKSRLFTRRLDQPRAAELAGTEGAVLPFFSPDGRWIAFFAGGELKKIPVEGGAAISLCKAIASRGGSWGVNDSIIAALSPIGPLSRISSAGGTPMAVTELAQGETAHGWPQILPGGRAMLFTVFSSGNSSIEAMSFKEQNRKTVLKVGTYGRYVPSGHLVYFEAGMLFAVPFDVDKLVVRGSPSPVLRVAAPALSTGSAQLDFSQDGTLVYQSIGAASGLVTMQWLDGAGKMQPLPAKPGLFRHLRLSPDGKLLAFMALSGNDSNIWAYDWQRDTMTRLTSGGGGFAFPVWSPDGCYIIFRGGGGLLWTRADGASKPQPLTRSKNQQYPWSFSPDGKRLAFFQSNPASMFDLWTVRVENQGGQLQAGEPDVYLQLSVPTVVPSFSPDGRWIAYASSESGSDEVYVRAFPDKGGSWQISNNGGQIPIWSRNKRELFYRTQDQRIMVVTYTAKGDSFIADKPRLWTENRLADTSTYQNLDITPDGKRFVVLMPAEGAEEQRSPNHVTFLLNFFDELRRRVSTGAK